MASSEAQGLFRLAAELRAELARIDRTVSELEQAAVRLGSATGDRLVLYGAADPDGHAELRFCNALY